MESLWKFQTNCEGFIIKDGTVKKHMRIWLSVIFFENFMYSTKNLSKKEKENINKINPFIDKRKKPKIIHLLKINSNNFIMKIFLYFSKKNFLKEFYYYCILIFYFITFFCCTQFISLATFFAPSKPQLVPFSFFFHSKKESILISVISSILNYKSE